MKRIFTLLLSMWSLVPLLAQSVQKSYDSGSDDYGNNVMLGDKAAFVCGTTNQGGSNYDQFLLKTDTLGNPLWLTKFGGAGFEVGRSQTMNKTNDGIMVGGTTYSYTTQGKSDISVSLIDSSGAYQGSIVFGFDSLNEYANSVIATSDTGFLIFGITQANGDNNHNDLFFIKIDASGTVEWQKTVGFPFDNENGLRVFEMPFGFIGCGSSRSGTAGAADAYFVNMGTDGSLQGQFLLGTAGDDDGQFFLFNNNQIIVSGITGSTFGPPRNNIYIAAIDPGTFNLVWAKTYGGDSATALASVNVDPVDGNYVVSGYTNGMGNSDQCLLFKVDSSNGSVMWSKIIGSTGSDITSGATVLEDGSTLMVAYTSSFGGTATDIFLAHTDPSGNLCANETDVPMTVRDYAPTIAGGPNPLPDLRDSVVNFPSQFTTFTNSQFTISQNPICLSTGIRNNTATLKDISIFPNPSDGWLLVKAKSAWKNQVIVTVFNTVGSVVTSQQVPPDVREFPLDLRGLDAGMYLIQFNDGQSSTTAKISIH